MARQIVLLVVFFAIIGSAFAKQEVLSAKAPASTPTTSPGAAAAGPSDDDAIGTSDEGSSTADVNEAPIGGPVSSAAFTPSTNVDAPSPTPNGATSFKAFGVAGVLAAGAVAGFLSF